jgi:hypothetical protein
MIPIEYLCVGPCDGARETAITLGVVRSWVGAPVFSHQLGRIMRLWPMAWHLSSSEMMERSESPKLFVLGKPEITSLWGDD